MWFTLWTRCSESHSHLYFDLGGCDHKSTPWQRKFVCVTSHCRQGCLSFGLCGPHQCSAVHHKVVRACLHSSFALLSFFLFFFSFFFYFTLVLLPLHSSWRERNHGVQKSSPPSAGIEKISVPCGSWARKTGLPNCSCLMHFHTTNHLIGQCILWWTVCQHLDHFFFSLCVHLRNCLTRTAKVEVKSRFAVFLG